MQRITLFFPTPNDDWLWAGDSAFRQPTTCLVFERSRGPHSQQFDDAIMRLRAIHRHGSGLVRHAQGVQLRALCTLLTWQLLVPKLQAYREAKERCWEDTEKLRCQLQGWRQTVVSVIDSFGEIPGVKVFRAQ